MKNKGIGAGGLNTNYYGKMFENKTNNEMHYFKNILKNKNYYLSKKINNKTVVFLSQKGLKKYVKNKYDIDLFRCPDEAYIIECENYKTIVKILEKKEQHVEGSVETKLWSGPSLKREYELVFGDKFKIEYGFCVNDFLKIKLTSAIKKYVILNKIFEENNISLLFGDDENYFEMLNNWINSSL